MAWAHCFTQLSTSLQASSSTTRYINCLRCLSNFGSAHCCWPWLGSLLTSVSNICDARLLPVGLLTKRANARSYDVNASIERPVLWVQRLRPDFTQRNIHERTNDERT